MTKVCNFCEKPIVERRNYVQAEFRKRNVIAKSRVNGVFETYFLHVQCAESVDALMRKFSPDELEKIIQFHEKARP